MKNLFLGTCSWKYDSWDEIVYKNHKRKNYLEEYSHQFNSVEIDQWFWSLHSVDKISLPKEKDVIEYSESVGEDFRFTIKVPNSITLTHFYRENKNEPLQVNPYFLSADLFNKFLDTIAPMKSKIGILMLQFEYLNKQKMKNQIEFMAALNSFINSIDTEYQIGVEIRNPNYLNQTFFDFLITNNLSPVLLHGYYMPPVWDIYKMIDKNIQTPVVIRLHGPDRQGIEAKTNNIWNQIVEPKDEEFEKIASIILYFQSINIDVYVNVNNHYEGSAPLTIKKLKNYWR